MMRLSAFVVRDSDLPALAAIVAGAVVMGISPVFVRVADVGPIASAFWRVALALPLLAAWARLEAAGRNHARPPLDAATVLAGAFFAGDLIFWHLAILHTSVANATLLATLAPVWVAAGSGFFIKEPVTRGTFAGLALCLLGALLLFLTSATVAAERLIGDLYGLITSGFFGAYFLAVRVARRRAGAGLMMFRSALVTAALLFVVAAMSEPRLLPASLAGWAAVAALAIGAHSIGQGLLAVALGRLPAAFSALVIFLEAVAAAAAGWVLLVEPVLAVQAAGALAILAGVWAARPRSPRGGAGAG
jgi:drug/metabolite transporter (DMT)-like permease